MKRIITYGTFDIMHYGHISILQRAKSYGDYLIVGLSTDKFNENEKKKNAYFSYKQRKTTLEAIRCVDLVIPEYSWEQKINDVKLYKADIFIIGNDWIGKFDFLKEFCKVLYLEKTHGISTTKIKKDFNL